MAGNIVKRVGTKVPARQEAGRDPFLAFRQSMDRLMDDFFRGFDLWPSRITGFDLFDRRTRPFTPIVDVRNEDKQVVVEAELPGVTEKDINVSLSADCIIIRGEKKKETEQEEKNFYRLERSYGSFERTLHLPIEIEPDEAEAKFKNGVLSIILPKTKEAIAQTRKIPIKVE